MGLMELNNYGEMFISVSTYQGTSMIKIDQETWVMMQNKVACLLLPTVCRNKF